MTEPVTYTVTCNDRTVDLVPGQALIYMPGLDTTDPRIVALLTQMAARLQATLMRSPVIDGLPALPTPPLPAPLALLESPNG